MKTVSVREAKTRLSRLIEAAAGGEEIVIARRGKPVARLVALSAFPEPRRPGALKGQIRIGDDFDSALPTELSRALAADIEFPRGPR